MKFFIHTEFGELLDLAMHLQSEGHEVLFHVANHDYSKVGEAIVPKCKGQWFDYLGQKYIWVVDGCAHGRMQDWLREKGELVFGGTAYGDKLENERQLNQAWFKKAGFDQPFSQNFTSIDDALAFVSEHKDMRFILKQNGDAPKSLNHMGKFSGNEDMIFHLQELKKKWNEATFGKVNFDLMEVVEGLEVAASAFWNGSDWMRNKEGKVVGYLNYEEKKECDGNTGETTGEMGTAFEGVTEDNKLFKDILMRPVITALLKRIGFRGVFDINGCLTKDRGYVAFEPTMRFGIPATSYEFMEGLKSKTGDLIALVAAGKSKPIEIHEGFGIVMVVAAKPYPVDAEVEDSATSIGEKLWILKDGKPQYDLSDEQKSHIHLENFERTEDGYRVATKNGYLLVVSQKGKSISDARESCIKYIKENIYISGMKYRSDIGERVENYNKK